MKVIDIGLGLDYNILKNMCRYGHALLINVMIAITTQIWRRLIESRMQNSYYRKLLFNDTMCKNVISGKTVLFNYKICIISFWIQVCSFFAMTIAEKYDFEK